MQLTLLHLRQTHALTILAGLLIYLLIAHLALAGTANGIQAFEAGKYKKAYEELKPAAQAGDAEAQYYLGVLLGRGLGVEKNYGEARRWLHQASDQGHLKAMVSLGYSYSHGLGVQQEKEKAVELYRRAAEKGSPLAQRNLGLMYYEGESINRDYAIAAKWFRNAAEQEDGVSQKSLCELYQFGFGVPQDHRRAAYWCRRAAENGNPAAQSALQSMILQGLADGDAVSAYAWALYSAKQDYPGGLQAWKHENRKWFLSEEQAERARAIVESGEWPVHPRFTEAEQERLRQRGSGRVLRMH